MCSGRNLHVIVALSALLVLPACSEGLPTSVRTAPAEQFTPSARPLVALQGRVDLVAGTMSIGGPAVDGAQLSAVYGDQNVTVRLYNTAVAPTVVGSKRRFTASVGIRNLRNHPIGDEQGGLLPADTSGIFVFFTSGPSVTGTRSPCASCAVSIQNAHGVEAFTGVNQPYFHFRERLSAAGSQTDTTVSRVTWTFEADTAVASFAFNVLVSAAWPAPFETTWQVNYWGDSLPHTQSEPRWRRMANGSGTSASASAGILTISMGEPDDNVDLYFQRRDSLGTTTNAFAEARLRLNSGNADPHTSFGFDDDNRQIEAGISNGQVGFIDAGYGFIDKISISTNVYRTYEIRKFAADSVQLWVDGTRRLTTPYGSFKPNDGATALPSYFRFGSHGKDDVGNSSSWDHVVYRIGSATP
jgi:hypothetical protein